MVAGVELAAAPPAQPDPLGVRRRGVSIECSPVSYCSKRLRTSSARSGSGTMKLRPPSPLVQVPEGRRAGPVALARLLVHPLLDLLGEVVDVVLGHQHLDAVDELLGRPRLVGQDDALLHEVDVDVHLVEQHPVLEVAVEPVGLLDEDHRPSGSRRLRRKEHLARERPRPVFFAVSTSMNSSTIV
jgi:hypothetical protein